MIVCDCAKLEAQTVQIFANPSTANTPHKMLAHIVSIIVVPQVLHLAIFRVVLKCEENFPREKRQLYPKTDATIPIKYLKQKQRKLIVVIIFAY